MSEWIPLLAGFHLGEVSPESFKAHVTSLYLKRTPRKAAAKEKKPFSFHVNQKGTLVLKVYRSPQWLTREEIDLISQESKIPLNVVWIKVLEREIKVSTQEVEAEISRDLTDFPW